MKKVILMAMAVAAMTACSNDNEQAPNVEGQKQQLDILTSIGTRAVISGTAMPQGSAIGVQVTQGQPGSIIDYVGQQVGGDNIASGHNVRFDNTADANVWVSRNSVGVAAKLMVGAETGTVYAYHPWAATVTGIGDAATIPANILTTGNIDLTGALAKSVNYAATETDFLYYAPAAARNTVSSLTTAVTPLTMVHAMASVSFRMYVAMNAPALVAGTVGDDKYYLMSYTIKNKTGKNLLCADNTSVTMNIADGTLTIPNKGGQISRTVNTAAGYPLYRALNEPAEETDKDELVWVSNLVFPIANIPTMDLDGKKVSQDMELVFSIKKGVNGTAANYTLPIATIVGQSDKWEAGKNYQYTIKLTASNVLSIEQVTVKDWEGVVGGDMEIK